MHQFDVKLSSFLLVYPYIFYSVRYADDLLMAFGATDSADNQIIIYTINAFFIAELSL